jgi:hypothetical protein
MEKDDGEFSSFLRGCLEMKIIKQRQNGFVLVFVIIVIILIGIEMYVLAGMANTIQYQSHRTYLKACERNLITSGLAWASENAQKSPGVNPGQMIELDVSNMDILGSSLEVTIGADGGIPDVRIQTSCSRGRQTLKSDDIYQIEKYDQSKTTPGTREITASD